MSDPKENECAVQGRECDGVANRYCCVCRRRVCRSCMRSIVVAGFDYWICDECADWSTEQGIDQI